MFKNMHALKNKLANSRVFFQQPKRFFNSSMKPPGMGSYISYGLLGAGTAGLAFLMMRGSALAHQK